MQVVVVESPAKAKTINKYLGKDYVVIASYGHIRDLPAKDGSVQPDHEFAMVWETDPKSSKQVREIASAVKKSDGLILATDPDREGEAISWHVRQVLEESGALKKTTPVQRVVFHEITKKAVTEAMANPRQIQQDLVDAYLARRALDYLVGFTLSPVLWRKLPGSRSAGRVQSVALRLICERETELEAFVPREYWTVDADFLTGQQQPLTAALTHLKGEKLDKFSLADQTAATAAKTTVEQGHYHIRAVERKRVKRNPYAPFTTSTLQQEASRKLYFSAKTTMQVAQKLYEGVDIGGETVGLITYMRTDGVQMAGEAIAAARAMIEKNHGARYLPSSPRLYKVKAKNAQEAHECIRPTDMTRHPDTLRKALDKDQFRLYELIWKRAVASQMASAELDQVAVDMDDGAGTVLRANGSVLAFDGFLALYREDKDDANSEDDADRLLPDVKVGDALSLQQVRADQHFTQPPPRFSEASLVKRLEELGIGRPSTYASIISVLQDRNYVRLDQRRFIPEDRGRIVTAFLENWFPRYVAYDFTADLENQLDDVSGGRENWRALLSKFWQNFSAAVGATKELRISEVLDTLDRELGPHFFPVPADESDPRICPTCGDGRLSLKLGKFGAFIGCSSYPECRYTRPLTQGDEGGDAAAEVAEGPKELGQGPDGELITLRKGPYGWYVQQGEGTKPKRCSLYRGLDPAQVTLDIALALLSLPREIGPHPETGKTIKAGVGRFGPYLQYDGRYKSLTANDDVLTVGMNRAVDLLAQPAGGGRAAAAPLRTLGERDGLPVTLHKGRYGPYVAWNKINATLAKDMSEDSLTLDQAILLLTAKAAKTPAKKATKASGKTTTKSAAKKPAAKAAAKAKAPTKKAAAKKAAPKKKAET